MNPFVFDEPVSREELADRDDELKDLLALMRGGRNAIVLSPRRYGKTSLLLAAKAEGTRRRMRVGYAELIGCDSEQMVAEKLAAAVAHGVLGPVAGLVDRSYRLLQALNVAVNVVPGPEGIRVTLIPTRSDTKVWRDLLVDLVRLLKSATKGSRPVCLMVDEFQKAAEVNAALPGTFKEMTDELKGVSLVLSGSRFHVMRGLVSGEGAPLHRVGEEIALGRITLPVMREYLVQRAAAGRKKLTAQVADRIYDVAEGIPSDVQKLAFWAFEAAERLIGDDAVVEATERILRHSWNAYDADHSALAPSQRAVMRGLAHGVVKEVHGREFREATGVGNPRALTVALEVLQAKDLVERAEDGYRVSDPFRRMWLARTE